MNFDLFEHEPPKWREDIADGAVLLRGFALDDAASFLSEIGIIASLMPFKKMLTPNGFTMSAAITSCGEVGWFSDAQGYRYTRQRVDEFHQAQLWPPMPENFLQFAMRAAAAAGYQHFVPDSCLINCYAVGAKMSLHQDNSEKDFNQPVVSVSLGLPATFLFGGLQRAAQTRRVPLLHGDVVVWGGRSRLAFHGVLPIKAGCHPMLGEQRINMTFRKAL